PPEAVRAAERHDQGEVRHGEARSRRAARAETAADRAAAAELRPGTESVSRPAEHATGTGPAARSAKSRGTWPATPCRHQRLWDLVGARSAGRRRRHGRQRELEWTRGPGTPVHRAAGRASHGGNPQDRVPV